MPFDSLDEAWPTIAKLIERRLKRVYSLIEDLREVKSPLDEVLRVPYRWPPSPRVPMDQLGFEEIEG